MNTPMQCCTGSQLSGTFPPAFVSVSSSNAINTLGAGVGTSPRLYVNVNSPNWCWSLIIPGFPPSLPACIEETGGAKAKRALIHKWRQRGAGQGLCSPLFAWGGRGGGARFSIPPPLNRTSLFLQAAARVFNGGAAGKSGLAGENTAGYCSKATAGLAAGPLGAFLASHS